MQVKNITLEKKIIEVARRNFFEHGYKKTNIEDIANESMTATANLYNYFSGKKGIFDRVVGDIPIQIDTYIAEYYTNAIKKIDIKKGIDLENLFPEELVFTEEVSMVLAILLEKSEGTQYAHYKEGLYSILQDCTRNCLGEGVTPSLINILSYSFIEKILSVIPRQHEKRVTDLELEQSYIKEDEIFNFTIDEEQKIVALEIYYWVIIEDENFKQFLQIYKNMVDQIIPSQYEYHVDCRVIPSVYDNDVLKHVLDIILKVVLRRLNSYLRKNKSHYLFYLSVF